MFNFLQKRKLQERAEDLIISAKVSADLANKTEFFDYFMECYDEILASFKEISDISEKISLKGIKGSPKDDYFRLISEQQWHIRDALERNYNRIVKEGKTIYRNNNKMSVANYRLFKEIIQNYSYRFDEETKQFANNLLKKLSLNYNISNELISDNSSSDNLNYDFDFLDGHEFEYWCANLLRNNGFEGVEVTPGSGDHGVDIIAEKEDIRYAIQCKCYSADLDNTPIQEVFAGKNMYHCQIGVVMTNRFFTKGARELADKTGVLLWDRNKLLKMMKTIK